MKTLLIIAVLVILPLVTPPAIARVCFMADIGLALVLALVLKARA